MGMGVLKGQNMKTVDDDRQASTSTQKAAKKKSCKPGNNFFRPPASPFPFSSFSAFPPRSSRERPSSRGTTTRSKEHRWWGGRGGGGRALLLKTTGFQKFQYISRNRLNYDARQSPLDSERGVELKNDVFTSNHGAYDWESCRHLQLLTWLTDPPQVPARPSTDERRYLVTRKMIPNINL